MELCDLPAIEISALVRSKQVSAEEILNSALKRISIVDGNPGSLEGEPYPSDPDRVHAFIHVTEKLARTQAQEVDRKIAVGEDPGLLAGVPVSVKDIFTVKDTPSTAASADSRKLHSALYRDSS